MRAKKEFKKQMINDKGQFVKGNIPWNKDMKGINIGGEETQFKPEHTPWNFKGVGAVGTPNYKRREVYVTIDEDREVHAKNGRIHHSKRRISIAKYKWLQSGREIPEGYIVYDNRPDLWEDPDIACLECISRAELLKRNTNG